MALRSEINGILMQTYVDLRNIFETVNNEFSKRIEETVTAKRSLEKELARVSVSFTLHCIVVKCRKNKRRAIKVSNQNPGKYDKVPVRLRRNVNHIKAFFWTLNNVDHFSRLLDQENLSPCETSNLNLSVSAKIRNVKQFKVETE